jgi:hypothetical protein
MVILAIWILVLVGISATSLYEVVAGQVIEARGKDGQPDAAWRPRRPSGSPPHQHAISEQDRTTAPVLLLIARWMRDGSIYTSGRSTTPQEDRETGSDLDGRSTTSWCPAGLSDSVHVSEKTGSDPRPSRYQLNQFLGHPELTGSPGVGRSPLVWLHDPSIGKRLKRNPSGSLGNF